MRRLATFTALAMGLAFPGTAAAAHEQNRHDCFGSAVAGVAGPGLAEAVPFLAQTFRPFGAAVISVEARTCEEVLP